MNPLYLAGLIVASAIAYKIVQYYYRNISCVDLRDFGHDSIKSKSNSARMNGQESLSSALGTFS
jgi:hypothetical protein